MAATTSDAEISGDASDGIGLCAGGVGTIPVQTPLLDIAVNVEESPGVGWRFAYCEGNDFVALLAVRVRIPTDFGVLAEFGWKRVASGVRGGGTGAREIFPL